MTHRPASLALRLTLSIGAVITVVLLTFGWVVERSISDHFAQQDVDELNAVVQALQQSLSASPIDEAPAALRRRLAAAVSGHHDAEYRISDASGAVIYATPGSALDRFSRLPPSGNKVDIGSVRIWQDDGRTYRGAVVRLVPHAASANTPWTVTVATGIDFHLRYFRSFRDYLRLITLAAALIAILAIWFAVYQGHAPIRRISREMRRIKSDQLYIRLAPEAVPAELTELAISFNDMLDRIESVFRRLSNFSADIAHEMRTPITNLMTQTEVALSQVRSVEQYREVLYSNLEEYERMAKMVSDMLFLAQADNKLLKPEMVAVDLADEVRGLFDYFEAWAEERAVALILAGPDVCVQGDRLMIRRALSNLLSNAIRHTPKGAAVRVSISATDDTGVLRVQNPASAISPEHLPHLFDRFYRPDSSRQRGEDGAGLGLAIVKSIVEAHGGSVSASSSENLITFEMILPT
ncbi:Cu(+)/Ag(+) sensor histidine kinase [Castellaniella caeni]|uniref:Cu(+)/Ag(+) sensor histidine kinase n=1 Tax=Castellaniella TaxID=359336 RepID=UPI000829D8BE|nr:Cu(+)/Ag(+) sensor histidine kinase [Castellaniella caeni]